MFLQRLMKRLVALGAAATLAAASTASACTGIMLKTADGSIVHGRTLEFGMFIDTSVVLVPRGYAFTGQTPLGPGKQWTAKCAAVGAIAFDDLAILDGMNEKGLAVGAFYFPTFADYTPTTPENRASSMSMADFPNWLLTSFSTVAEVRAAVEAQRGDRRADAAQGLAAGAAALPLCRLRQDGRSIAIEPIGGKLKVFDNPLGVMTNSPSFDWHMTNLRNYIALNPQRAAHDDTDTTFRQLGQGSGMLGLPGDFSPPSRFVRAAVFSATAIPEKTAERGIYQVFHILNNFAIPVGVAREEHDGVVNTDYTMLTVARDPQALKYYWKSYEDQTIRIVDMNALDLDAKSVVKLSTKGEQTAVDDSKEMK